MRCALLQLNAKVGDVTNNAEAIIASALKAAERGATLCITSELALTGYPPLDLLFYPSFIDEVESAAKRIAKALAGVDTALVLGAPGRDNDVSRNSLHNMALFLYKGQIQSRYSKRLLPTYDVFDESRYFEPGAQPCLVEYRGLRIALTVCEDIWNDSAFNSSRLYMVGPLDDCPPFDVLVNLSASPFVAGKQTLRQELVTTLARRYRAHVLYVNAVGGNDELIFDGRSFYARPDGRIAARALPFEEDCLLLDTELRYPQPAEVAPAETTFEAEVWRALVLGLRDYCRKNGILRVGLGLSGGIDSALVAVIACEALGPENICGYLLPSPFSSTHSLEDAQALAARLGIRATVIPIRPGMDAFDSMLANSFAGKPPDVTEENIQARLRGDLLMALSNKLGFLLVATGNKSELSVGYCTIYGDMCGGLSVIGDLYKTDVYRLCHWLNATRKMIIPERILTKLPSAELRQNQTDQDTLPPYDVLDAILIAMLEERKTCAELVAQGHAPEIVRKVACLVSRAEFKRRQSAPILKISRQAFGAGWRMPVTCRQALLL